MRGGTPSTTAPTAGQCDSPNVDTLNNVPKVLDMIATPSLRRHRPDRCKIHCELRSIAK